METFFNHAPAISRRPTGGGVRPIDNGYKEGHQPKQITAGDQRAQLSFIRTLREPREGARAPRVQRPRAPLSTFANADPDRDIYEICDTQRTKYSFYGAIPASSSDVYRTRSTENLPPGLELDEVITARKKGPTRVTEQDPDIAAAVAKKTEYRSHRHTQAAAAHEQAEAKHEEAKLTEEQARVHLESVEEKHTREKQQAWLVARRPGKAAARLTLKTKEAAARMKLEVAITESKRLSKEACRAKQERDAWRRLEAEQEEDILNMISHLSQTQQEG